MLCLCQNAKYPDKALLKKKTISCSNSPDKFQEMIYKYKNGNLFRIDNYYNTQLTVYEEMQYNLYGKEIIHVSYSSDGEIFQTELTVYDSKQNMLNWKQLDKDNVVKVENKYDTLSRLISENYYNKNDNPDYSCSYNLYDYSNKRWVKKSYYVDCSLNRYEINTYNNLGKKMQTEFFSHDHETGSIVYKYNDSLLVYERGYDSGEQLSYEKHYIYNPDNQLTETFINNRIIDKNFYENERLIRSEHYDYSHIHKPPACSGTTIVEYEYF